MEKEKKNKVVMYVRNSRLKDSEGMEIERQIEILEEYAEAHNLEVAKIYSEQGSSEDGIDLIFRLC